MEALNKAPLDKEEKGPELIDKIIASLLSSNTKEAYYEKTKIQKIKTRKKTVIIIHNDTTVNEKEIEKISGYKLINKAKSEESPCKTILTFVKDLPLNQETKKHKKVKPHLEHPRIKHPEITPKIKKVKTEPRRVIKEKQPSLNISYKSAPKPDNSPKIKYPEVRKIKKEIEKVRKEKILPIEIQHELNQIENNYIPKLIELLEESRIKPNEFSDLTTKMNSFIKKVKDRQEIDIEVEALKNLINKKYGSTETTD